MGTFSSNILPSATGEDLGSPAQRWDLFAQSVDLSSGLNVAGASTFTTLNGIRFADQFAGADASIKINAAIADVIAAGGGVVDARGLSGAQTISQQITVGNSGNIPVHLILPPAATYTCTINDNTKYALLVKSGTIVECAHNGGIGTFSITSGVGSHVKSLVATEPTPTGGGAYIIMRGITVLDPNASVSATGACIEIQNIFDASYFESCFAGNFFGVGIWVHNTVAATTMVCCGADGFGNAGAQPVKFGGVNSTAIYAMNVFGLSATHPGNTKNAVLVESQATTSPTNGLYITGLYLEEVSTGDTTTPYVAVKGAQNLILDNVVLGSQVDVGGRYLVDIANVAGTGVLIRGIQSLAGATALVNDHINSVTISQAYLQEYRVGSISSFQGQIQLGKGTAAAPSIVFGPEQMGLYWFGSHILGLTNPQHGASWTELIINGQNDFLQLTPAGALAWAATGGDANAAAGTSISQAANGTLQIGSGGTVGNTGNLALGKLTTYNGVATVSGGVPAEYATVDLTAQGAAITTTTLYAVPASGVGQYRVQWNAKITTVDAVSSTLGALTIGYTDPDGVALTMTAPATILAGTIATSSTGNVTSTALMGLPLMLNCKASTNVTYAFAYVSNTPGQMKFNLHLKLEAL